MELVRRLEHAGHEAWCVGGAVRDALLGIPSADFDIATSATPEQVQRLFRRTVPVGIRFGTVGVFDATGVLHEVTTFRADVETDGRHAVVRFGVSLEEDLARRDFTINAIAFHPLRREWRDPFGGRTDIEARCVRAVGDPELRFREDYLRILRAIRFAARFGFALDRATHAAARALAPGLAGLSAERVFDEWKKGLATVPSLRELVALWHDTGAATVWLPELHAPVTVERLTLPTVEATRDLVQLTAALTRDPAAVLRRLKAPAQAIARASALARGPALPDGLPADDEARRRVVRHWMAAVGNAVEDMRAVAALRGGDDPAWGRVVDDIRARGEATTREQLAIGGRDLLAAGIAPGPALGRTLDRLLALVLDEPARNTRDTLLALAREGA